MAQQSGNRLHGRSLKFTEAAEVLVDLAKWANIVVDPLMMAEKLRADSSSH
jgi:hypothetical protein